MGTPLDHASRCARRRVGKDGRVPSDRERLRATFDTAADRYQRARPEYPAALFDALVSEAQLQPGHAVLEIGCATGKATLPLARRGLRITCIELGPDLAAAARMNLAAFPAVEVVEGAFETWTPAASTAFDAVVAATSWHWIDPAVRDGKAASLLRRGGHLAFWSAAHVFPDGGDPFFAEIQAVYDEIGEALPPGASWPRPGELPDDRAEIEATGLFDDVVVRHFDWEVAYDAASYLDLLDTFSGHIALEPARRERLYGEIRRRLRSRPDGHLRRHWGAVLHVARRR
jgi:SAM-dependent methyltransferase